MIKSLTVKTDEGLHIRMRRKDAEGHSAHIGTSAGRRGSMFDRWTADGSVGDPRSILPKVSFHRRKMDKFQLLVLMCVLTYVQAATVDYNQLVANVNRFKTNLNRNVVISFSSPANMQIFLLFFFVAEAQAFLLSIWQGAIGGISAFWWAYSFWMVLGIFYFSYATIYKTTKAADAKEHAAGRRAIPDSLMSTIFHSLTTVPSKYEKAMSDPCTHLVKCHAKNYVATSRMVTLVPRFM